MRRRIGANLLSLLAGVASLGAGSLRADALTSAAGFATRAQQAAQSAIQTHNLDDFTLARSNILKAIALDPTNQNYLVAATTYLDWKTRYTRQKELDGYKFAEQAVRLSRGKNADAYFHAATALDYIGYPSKAYFDAQQGLQLGGLSAEEQETAQKIVKNLTPRKTILLNTLDAKTIRNAPSGLAQGQAFFYYPVPPSLFINQTAEYSVTGALKWDKVESNGDTFLRIWPGAEGTIEVQVIVTRFETGRKVIFEDHSKPLPPEVAAFTRPTAFIDSSSFEIQVAAKNLRRKNWVETAKAIGRFVNKGWNYIATGTSSQSSTSALHTRTGMCMDEANLCVALARANGIPARMVRGCEPYDEGGSFTGLTTGHFWAEVYIPGTGWCEFVSDADCFGWMPWFCIRWCWQDTENLHQKKWDPATSGRLDLAIKPPLMNEEMERTKYILWFGMTEQSINQIGTRWHMMKDW